MNTNELEAMSKAHSELSPASQSLDYEAVIFKLPDELLLEVFLLLRDAMYPSLHPYPALHQLPSWVAVSCVCARFRRVALGSPGLHTCIPMRALPRKLTKQELTLSRPLDLDIETRMSYSDHYHNNIPALLSKYSRRIRTLRLQEVNYPSYFMRVIGAWLQAVPRLKHLSLTQTRETRRGDASTVEHIEASLFIAPAAVALIPELTALHVDGLDLELTSDIFLNLVELSFTRTTFHDTPRRGNPANLRAVFQRMQKLRKLALVDVRFGSFPDNDIGLPPSLHHLEYSGGSLDALSRLKPSASVRVKLIRTGPPITASKYRDTPILVDVFNAWLGSETPATAVRLTSRSNSHTSEVRVAYWRNTGSHANGLAPDFEFNRRFDGTSWVEDIITGSTHNNITHATLDVDWDSPLFRGKADWLECFGPLPYLHTLMLTGPPMETPVHTVGLCAFIEWLRVRNDRGHPVQQLVLPAHMATVLDEMVSTADVGVVGWRTLVSDVHVRRLA